MQYRATKPARRRTARLLRNAATTPSSASGAIAPKPSSGRRRTAESRSSRYWSWLSEIHVERPVAEPVAGGDATCPLVVVVRVDDEVIEPRRGTQGEDVSGPERRG